MDTLTEKERKILGMALFDAGMKLGPSSFETLEGLVQKLGVTDQWAEYAVDFVSYIEKLNQLRDRGK